MVYDCFTFYNELDLLEIRLATLDDVVDRFVIVEATKTHRGVPKRLNFKENEARFSRFKEKIIYIAVDDFPSPEEHYINSRSDDWTLENWQRHCICRGLTQCKPDDIIIVSDLDEIPKPKILCKTISTIDSEIVALEMDHYNFYLNYLTTQPAGTAIRIVKYKTFRSRVKDSPLLAEREISILPCYRQKADPNHLRSSHFDKFVPHAAWHFSYLGDLNTILLKTNSIVETPAQRKLIAKETAERIYNGRDINFLGYVMRPIIRMSSLPPVCREPCYSHLIYRAPSLHRIMLFAQFYIFQMGMISEILLKKMHLSTGIIHLIRRILPI